MIQFSDEPSRREIEEDVTCYVMTSEEYGDVYIFLDGFMRVHREYGPAIIAPGKMECWYQHGDMHRDDGPAWIELFDNGKYEQDCIEFAWVQHGNLIHSREQLEEMAGAESYFAALLRVPKVFTHITSNGLNPGNILTTKNKYLQFSNKMDLYKGDANALKTQVDHFAKWPAWYEDEDE